MTVDQQVVETEDGLAVLIHPEIASEMELEADEEIRVDYDFERMIVVVSKIV